MSGSGLGKWGIFVMCAIPYFSAHFHRVSTAVIASDLQLEFGLSGSVLGLLSSAYFYSYSALQIPVGVAADRTSPRLVISAGMAVAAAGSFLLGISRNYVWAVAGRILAGAGVAAIYVPALILLAGVFGSDQLATVTGLMLAVGSLGGVSASTPFAWMVSIMGWRRSFLVIGVLSTVIALVCWQLLRGPWDSACHCRTMETGGKTSGTARNDSVQQTFDMSRVGLFVGLGLIMFLKYGPMMGYQGLWGVPYITDVYGVDKMQASGVLMWIPIGYMLGCPLMGWLADSVGLDRYRLLTLANAVYLAAWVPLAWRTNQASIPALCASSFVLGSMGGGSTVLIHSIAGKCGDGNGPGTGMGIVNACSLAGGAVFQPFMGLIIERVSEAGKSAVDAYGAAFRFAFFSVLAVLLLSIPIRRLSKNHERAV